MALALLPANIIAENAKTLYETASEQLQHIFETFHAHFQKQWLE